MYWAALFGEPLMFWEGVIDNTLGGVKKRVRSLVGDPLGDYCTDAYLTPLINQVYEDQSTALMSETGSSFDDWVFDVPNVPIGTTNLGTYQSAQMPLANQQGPLYGLVSPEILEWKILGQPDIRYVEATRVAKLPNISPGAPQPLYQMWWEWRDNTIYVTPMTQPVDMRVRGEFSPPSLVKDTDILIIHPRMATATAYGTAALIGAERNNQNYVTTYSAEAESVLEDISNWLVKIEQGVITRIGRYGGRRGGFGR